MDTGEAYPFTDKAFKRPISTTSPDAQRWFNIGLNLAYAFNHEEAVVCFRKCLEHDEECAMAYWGIAFCQGINYNSQYVDEQKMKLAYESVEEAVKLLNCCSDVEKDLIKALSHRYIWPYQTDLEKTLEAAYSSEIQKVFEKYPNDVDVIALFVESVMNLRPWQLWTKGGKPEDRTEEILAILEKAIKDHPPHPGIYHFYIHVIEMSPFPERALEVAHKLGAIYTDYGHLLHMPSHIFVRVGHWNAAIISNQAAAKADDKYWELRSNRHFYTIYVAHNLHFIVYACMFDGQYQVALDASKKLVGVLTEDTLEYSCLGPFCEGLCMVFYHVYVRFGKWKEILELSAPEKPEIFKFSTVLHHYARGIAFASLNNVAEAEKEEALFNKLMKALPENWKVFNNTCKDIGNVGKKMLRGEIEYRKGNFELAFEHLRKSAEANENLVYDEPWSWMQPPRHALGALLLEQGRVTEAEVEYRKDLEVHPNNFWALHGLAECLEMQGKDGVADAQAQRDIARERFDVPANASCYCRLSKQ